MITARRRDEKQDIIHEINMTVTVRTDILGETRLRKWSGK